MTRLRAERYWQPDATVLVVILHGFGGKPADMNDIRQQVIRPHLSSADVIVPRLPYSSVLAIRRMRHTVENLVELIDRRWYEKRTSGRPYERIILVGHSGGSIMARAVLLQASGIDSEGVAPSEREWASRIERVVLLAGMNRGWSEETPLGLLERIKFSLGNKLASALEYAGLRPTILDLRRGAPFLTSVRLDWLRYLKERNPETIVVQLLGTQDNLVNPEDDLDLATGASFRYREVPLTDHYAVVALTPRAPLLWHFGRAVTPEQARARKQELRIAITGTKQEIENGAVELQMLSRERLPPEPRPEVEHAIIIMHGIRDRGFWSQKIARRIREEARKRGPEAERKVEIVNPSYGFFPVMPFLMWHVRRRKVEWLMDRYVEVRRQYPNARISYVGHSNGTYLLAGALKWFPFARFHRIVFAGSMVRRDFDWSRYVGDRVEKVINFVATRDLVVASVPKGAQGLNLLDIGSAGHDGFSSPDVKNVRYVAGGHGAAISEQLWDDIAALVVNDDIVGTSEDAAFLHRRSPLAVLLGWVAPFLLTAVSVCAFIWCWQLFAALIGRWSLPIPWFDGFNGDPYATWLSVAVTYFLARFVLLKF